MLEQKDLEAIRARMKEEINMVQKNLDELGQYYRILKLESNNDNMALLLKMIDELSRRVEELEKRTA